VEGSRGADGSHCSRVGRRPDSARDAGSAARRGRHPRLPGRKARAYPGVQDRRQRRVPAHLWAAGRIDLRARVRGDAMIGAASLVETVRYRGLLRNLLARDLSVRYKNSVLGFLWTLLNPLLL